MIARRTALLVLLAAGLACGGSKRIGKPITWPPEPATPRIRFVTSFSSTKHLDNSSWANFKRGVFGGGEVAIQQPMGLALSEDGKRLYIADLAIGNVIVADFKAKKLRRLSKETLARPFDVALDADENVYVVDSAGGRIVVYSKSGKRLRSFGAGDFVRPTGIAIDRERSLVYIVDSANKESPHHRVRVFGTEGKHRRDLGPEGGETKGGGDGQFYFPVYVSVDADGNVYVGDMMNFRIQKFGPDGEFLLKYGQNGDGPGAFARIKDLAFDGFGNIYVVDGGHGVVQMFNQRFDLLMWFGGPVPNKLEFFDLPTCIEIEPKTNRIYVCNTWTPRINVYELINTTAEDSIPSVKANEGEGSSDAAGE